MNYEQKPIIEVEKSPIITNTVLAKFEESYKKLKIEAPADGNTIYFVVGELPKPRIEDVVLDLAFYKANPQLPAENICNHFWNYEPKNDSQAELLMWADGFVKFEDPKITAAGLFMYGTSGVGKTHISVATTKELIKKGQKAYFLSVDDLKRYPRDDQLGPEQVWILDDLNSPYALGMRLFKQIVLNAHNRGGRIFATSNTDYDELMEKAFVGEEEQKARYMDRTRGMFKTLKVTGESSRLDNLWYEKLNLSLDILNLKLNKAVQEENFEEAVRIRKLIEQKR
jgi:Cdc6-like AAA superfamily ATPase